VPTGIGQHARSDCGQHWFDLTGERGHDPHQALLTSKNIKTHLFSKSYNATSSVYMRYDKTDTFPESHILRAIRLLIV
jgi:hypothetical protein